MLCANCKKNQATKSYACVKNATPTTEYFCLDCYEKLFRGARQQQAQKGQECPYCGMTVETLKKRQLVGCAMCYQTLGTVTNAMVFVLGGGVSKAGSYIVDLVQKQFVRFAFPATEPTRFGLAILGNDAGIYGAAKLVLNN